MLKEDELQWLCQRSMPALAPMQVLSRLLCRAHGLTDQERTQLQELLSEWDSVTGVCEKLLYQPIPTAYTRCVGACPWLRGMRELQLG